MSVAFASSAFTFSGSRTVFLKASNETLRWTQPQRSQQTARCILAETSTVSSVVFTSTSSLRTFGKSNVRTNASPLSSISCKGSNFPSSIHEERIWYLIFNQLFYICSNHILEGRGRRRLPASRRRAEARSWHRKQSRKPHGRRDRGCGLHPVRWMKDEIAQNILGRKAQNAQPTHLPPLNIHPPHFHIPSPSSFSYFSRLSAFFLSLTCATCTLHLPAPLHFACSLSLMLSVSWRKEENTKFTPLRPF